MTDDRLAHMLAVVPPRSVVLLEDSRKGSLCLLSAMMNACRCSYCNIPVPSQRNLNH